MQTDVVTEINSNNPSFNGSATVSVLPTGPLSPSGTFYRDRAIQKNISYLGPIASGLRDRFDNYAYYS